MRTKFLFMLCSFMVMFFTLSSFKTEVPLNEVQLVIQDSKEIDAVYDGHADGIYRFTVRSNGETDTLSFQKIDDAILSDFDLSSQTLVGVSFKVTYTTKVVVTKSADGNDIKKEVNTITKLEKL
ncbi:hypothetical protein Q4Q35_09325 [Flavivirga aquimarina]|uniref:Uncharacterized protein n=1 Tax=Flavivirga aquimarina TaxID=2027862 RepID=A0ABT8WA68_9FLAO|nr:hypothetical protein [Flavivirga aquimarina]MDO5970010.1 hypothetical protein [Flavivirga aquimarina]